MPNPSTNAEVDSTHPIIPLTATESVSAAIMTTKSQLFVPTTILFCFPIILLLNQILVNLKYPDLCSYILLVVGGVGILRSYLVGFIALNKTYIEHRWLLFVVNLALVLVALWLSYSAIFDLTLNTFPDRWFLGITAANLLFLAAIWVNRIYNSQYIQIQLLQIIFSMMSIGALWQLIFGGQRWFLTLLAIIMGLFETYLLVALSRLLYHLEQPVASKS